MVAATSFPTRVPALEDEARVLLTNVPWATYVMLRDTVDSPAVRMTYLRGSLEIMRTSRTHEVGKKQIARLLELYCLERDMPLYGYGSTTFRNEEAERGLEPDECYCRDADRPVPDIALEVVVSKPLIDKLEVYRGLGVQEIWVLRRGQFQLFTLHGGRYEPLDRSEVFPEVDLERIAHYAGEADQHAALRAFRDELRCP